MKNKLEYAVFGYEPDKFLPVRYDGKLSNKSSFILYKLGRVIYHVVMALDDLYQAVQQYE